MSFSRSAGNGASAIHERITLPHAARASTSLQSRVLSFSAMRSSSLLAEMNSRKASAVVANPPGTRMPASDSAPVISPSEEFLPPTCAKSFSRRSLSQATRMSLVFYEYDAAPHCVFRLRWHGYNGADARPQPADPVRGRGVQSGHL